MQRPSSATITIFWVLGNNSRLHASASYEAAEAYTQPAPYRTDETVKSELNRLMLLVYELQPPISGQAYARYPHRVAYRSPPWLSYTKP